MNQPLQTWEYSQTLDEILETLAQATGNLTDDNGNLISDWGIGSNAGHEIVTDVFAIRDFCWCEGAQHEQTVFEDDTDEETWHMVMCQAGGTGPGCPPNFEHFASGTKATWYKTRSLDTFTNHDPDVISAQAILTDCLASLAARSR